MSKPFTKEDVIQNKKSAISALNKQLEYYINDSSGKHLKKANLISYWIKDYMRMIKFEETFNPTKNMAYKRGNIVKINFGFNIGNEYGGLHYGIVLDKHNAHNSPVVTVIPLTSVKEGKEIHENNVFLENDLYRLLKIKYDTILKSVVSERDKLRKMMVITQGILTLAEEGIKETRESLHDASFDMKSLLQSEENLDNVKELAAELKERSDKAIEQLENLKKIEKEISQMKKGSIALINQITTISKIRIYDPKNSNGVLSGITLSQEQMEKINNKVKSLYIF